MPNCPNCGRDVQGGMKFCPNCGQDQAVLVPQDQRIPTDDVPVPPPPRPPPSDLPRGGPRRRKWVIGLLGCGGLVGLLLVALLVVAAVSGPANQTAQSEGGGQEDGDDEKKPAEKKKSGAENAQVAVGETAELRDRTLVVNEVQKGYPPPRQIRIEPGNELLRVYVTLRNTSNQAFSYNPLNFKVQDSNGVQESRQVMMGLPYPIEPGSLAPEGTMEGNLVFEVPQGDSNLQLIYEANPIQRQTITVGPL
jgi:Domain of unknown function (DUF4352)/zinc-ribbon domain